MNNDDLKFLFGMVVQASVFVALGFGLGSIEVVDTKNAKHVHRCPLEGLRVEARSHGLFDYRIHGNSLLGGDFEMWSDKAKDLPPGGYTVLVVVPDTQ